MPDSFISGIQKFVESERAGVPFDDLWKSTFTSVSVQCGVALIYDRPDLLPRPFTTTAAAWGRLDAHQRGLVREFAPDVAAFLGGQR